MWHLDKAYRVCMYRWYGWLFCMASIWSACVLVIKWCQTGAAYKVWHAWKAETHKHIFCASLMFSGLSLMLCIVTVHNMQSLSAYEHILYSSHSSVSQQQHTFPNQWQTPAVSGVGRYGKLTTTSFCWKSNMTNPSVFCFILGLALVQLDPVLQTSEAILLSAIHR